MDQRIANELDPIALEVIRNKLEGIASEMQYSLLRSAFSPIGNSVTILARRSSCPRNSW